MTEQKTRQRSDMHRINQEENSKYRGFLGFSIFILVAVAFFMGTIMNPGFMKNQIAKDSNIEVVNNAVNARFDSFANYLGSDKDSDKNLLNSTQTLPIANELLDYTLGFHWFKTDTSELAKDIQKLLVQKIDDDSSTEAKSVQKLINKSEFTAQYAVASGFDLDTVLKFANAVTLGWIIGGAIILLAALMIISVILRLKHYFGPREIIHNFFGSSMWAGAFLIGIFGIISILPSVMNVERVFGQTAGLMLEVGSGIFLELVIVGVGLFIVSVIPFNLSTTK